MSPASRNTTRWNDWIGALLLAALLSISFPGEAAAYEQFVQVEDIEARYINGELRFCERQNLDGMVCGRKTKVFGKKVRMVQDWWSPQTYAEAYAGMPVNVTSIAPSPYGGLIIYFEIGQ